MRGIAGYHSALMEFLGAHSEVLERLATEMYARGLSTRDIEAAFTDATGRCVLSRSAVSELTDTLWEEYEAFCERDLSSFEVIYLFVDGVYESLRRAGGPKEALLCAWGICEDGRRAGAVAGAGGGFPAERAHSLLDAQDAKRAGQAAAGGARPGQGMAAGGA